MNNFNQYNKYRKDFPLLMSQPGLVYFDNGATAQKPQVVIDAINRYYLKECANGARASYNLAFKAYSGIEKGKQVVADFIGAKDVNEIVFTSGATEALNNVAKSLSPFLQKGDEIILSDAEHVSNILPWMYLAKTKKVVIKWAKLNDDLIVTAKEIESLITSKTKIISLCHISNVVGKYNEINKIGKIAKKAKVFFVIDGTQSVIHRPVNVEELNCSFFAFSGHKLFAPTGIGVLYINKDLLAAIDPAKFGGGAVLKVNKQDFTYKMITKFEPGTANYAGIYGLSAAMQYLNKISFAKIQAVEKELIDYFLEKIKEVDGLFLYNPNPDVPIFSFNIKGIFCQDVAEALNSANIAVRVGDHCAKLMCKYEDSHNRYVRVSMCFYNSKQEIDYLVQQLKTSKAKFLDGLF